MTHPMPPAAQEAAAEAFRLIVQARYPDCIVTLRYDDEPQVSEPSDDPAREIAHRPGVGGAIACAPAKDPGFTT